jgi:tetratricopeptide (TPR) repeat protein
LRFYHDLVREALYEEIPPGQRARLHLGAGNTLESMYDSDLDPHLAEIAHHYFESASIGETTKAVDYTRHAAEHATGQLAYEDAVALYHMALQAAELQDGIDSTVRGDLLLGLGDVQARSGDLPGARDTFLGAYDIARQTNQGPQAAQAALGYGGRFAWERAGDDPHLVPMLQDALALLGGDDDRIRVRLLSRLACALRDSPDRQRSASLSRQAVALAQTLQDPFTLAWALEGHIFSIWWPENSQERLDLATDLVELAAETHDGERIAGGHAARYIALLELGETIAAETEIEKLDTVAHEIRQPAQLWAGKALRAVLLLLEGRFDEAEPLIEESLHAGQPSAVRDNVSAGRFQMFLLRREQGRVDETESLISDSVDEFYWYPLHRPALACLLFDLGRNTEARMVFDQLARDDFTIFNHDNEWLLGMSLAAEACSLLEDKHAAEGLYQQLLPFTGRHALGIPEGSVGAVDRYLGLLAVLMGQTDQAETHFQDAITLNQKMGARPWVAHSRHNLAQLLLTRARLDDHQHAADHLHDAHTAANEMGMVALTTKIERIPREPET